MIVKFSEIQELRCTHKFSEGLRYRPDTGSQGNPVFVPERSQLILLHSCVMIRRLDTSGKIHFYGQIEDSFMQQKPDSSGSLQGNGSPHCLPD